jgi:hypothetical protein
MGRLCECIEGNVRGGSRFHIGWGVCSFEEFWENLKINRWAYACIKSYNIRSQSSEHINSQFITDSFVQRLDHESSKDALLLSKTFQDMMNFKLKYNKEHEEKNQKMICFVCHREWHTIQSCFNLFSHLINKEGERSQDRKSQYKSDGYKSKKKAKAMQAMCNANQITVTPTAQAHNKKNEHEILHNWKRFLHNGYWWDHS